MPARWTPHIVLVVLLAVAATSCGDVQDHSPGAWQTSEDAGGGSAAGEADEVDDVKLASCGVDEDGAAAATILVTNDSSARSDYIIEVTFESKDGRMIGAQTSFVRDLGPGQSKTEDVSSLEGAGDGGLVCSVSRVDRSAPI